jgi:hypothetical protein
MRETETRAYLDQTTKNAVREIFTPNWNDISLPAGSVPLSSVDNEYTQAGIAYLQHRGIFDYTEWYWCDSDTYHLYNRIILPLTYKNNTVGFHARWIGNPPDKKTAKVIKEQQKEYVYGIDQQNDLRKYEGKIATHQVALEEYRVRRNSYEEEQKKSVRPIANEEALKKIVMVAMQREASEEAEEKYWNQTFFSAITDGKQFVFGREAINMYAEDPMGGFFMRSPKSFLATDLKAEYKNTFVKIVENKVSEKKYIDTYKILKKITHD